MPALTTDRPRARRREPTPYDRAFQAAIQDGSLESARRIVPTLIDLVHPETVLDVGCGTGAWLSIFHEQGVDDVIGVDGDYVARDMLLIPPPLFEGKDVGRPFSLDRRFDLVVSVEVGEHLPAAHSEAFVGNLVAHGDVIAFSAAIPNQGGEDHINERWPSYWKPLFERHDYVLVDCLRRRFWNDAAIERWYRQNLLLYVRREKLASSPRLQEEYEANQNQILDIVHPESFYPLALGQLLRSFPASLKRAIGRRL